MFYSTGMKRNSMDGIRQCGMYRVRKPYTYRPKSVIIRRGKTLENGDILWMEDGRLYIEKKS